MHTSLARARPLAFLVLAAACSEFGLFGKRDGGPGAGDDTGADAGACGEVLDAPYTLLNLEPDCIPTVGWAGDVDRDGRDDLWIFATCSWSFDETPDVGWLVPGSSDGGRVAVEDVALASIDTFAADPLLEGGGATILDDLDGDGLPEVAVAADEAGATGDYGRVAVFYSPFAGDLAAGDADRTLLGPLGMGGWLDASSDLTGDGVRDLVVSGTDEVGAWIVGEIPPGQQFIQGRYDAVLEESVLGGLSHGFSAIATGDLDGDGVGDLAASEFGLSEVSVFLGPLNGTLTAEGAHVTWSAATTLGDLSVLLAAGGTGDPPTAAGGDGDGDGRADLAVSAAEVGTGTWLVSGAAPAGHVEDVGFAVFSDPDVSVFGADVRWLGDVNRDGWDDLALHVPTDVGSCGGTEAFFFGPLGGVIDLREARSFVGADWEMRAVRVGDVDGDGADDLAFTSKEGIDEVVGSAGVTYVVPVAAL